MPVYTLAVVPLAATARSPWDEPSKRAIVVDPGGDFPKIREILDRDSLSVVAIIHTHAHIHHVGATESLCDHSGAYAQIPEADRFLHDLLPVQATMLGIPLPPVCQVGGTLKDGTTLRAGAIELGVVHTDC